MEVMSILIVAVIVPVRTFVKVINTANWDIVKGMCLFGNKGENKIV
jgi:hypothetical protein